MYPFMPGPAGAQTQSTDDDSDPVAETEEDRVLRWHRDRLVTLGWPLADADNIAVEFPDLDPHEVEALVKRGCPRGLAVRIAT